MSTQVAKFNTINSYIKGNQVKRAFWKLQLHSNRKHSERPVVLPPTASALSLQMATQWKRQMLSRCCYENCLISQSPETDSRSHEGTADHTLRTANPTEGHKSLQRNLKLHLVREKCWSDQIRSVAQLYLCDPMNRSTPGLPVHHQLPEFAQTHVHRVGDAIQPSYPLLSPSPPSPSPSQHQSFPMNQLFAWGGQSTGVSALASFLPMNTKDWSPLE